MSWTRAADLGAKLLLVVLLVTLPWSLDVLGNRLNLFDTVAWWFAAFVRHSPELSTAYTDTLGDLALGSLGALLAGLVVAQCRPGRVHPKAAGPVRR